MTKNELPFESLRTEFHFPTTAHGKPAIYLCGNSLGLQPKGTRAAVERELDDWARHAVEGYWNASQPWIDYPSQLIERMARVVGAKPSEVVVMNTLTVNLHLMMTSFYRPTRERFKILMEASAFPSDQYAVASQAKLHGFDPKEAILEIKPRAGESLIRPEDILKTIEREGKSIALVLIGSVNYLTGQAFDVPAITRKAQENGCKVGFDFAHGVGNLELKLHDWDLDFAVWCTYKYLNSGPGAVGGAFIHERHANSPDLQRLAGWWGQNKQTRFLMGPNFDPIPGAEGWQLSNTPILQRAALGASLELFERAGGMPAVRAQSVKLTGHLEKLIDAIPGQPIQIVSPRNPDQRGNQLSLRVPGSAKEMLGKLKENGVICDFREPDIIRLAPAPLYNTMEDCLKVTEILSKLV